MPLKRSSLIAREIFHLALDTSTSRQHTSHSQHLLPLPAHEVRPFGNATVDIGIILSN